MNLIRVSSIFTLLAGSLAYGQVAGSGTIQGMVSDPTRAVICGASVTATNTATGVQTVRQATAAGFFVLSPLPAGRIPGHHHGHSGTSLVSCLSGCGTRPRSIRI